MGYTYISYSELKKNYPAYKRWLARNMWSYNTSSQIVTGGITLPDYNIGQLDLIYSNADKMKTMYEVIQALVNQLDDVGFKYVS